MRYAARILAAVVAGVAVGGAGLGGGAARADGADKTPPVGGLQGGLTIPFTMPCDGEATIALYNANGQVVRILGQVLPLAKGEHQVRWDGMDLWGNLVPVGTELTARVITNPGVKVFYEFAVDNAAHPPWMTKPVGEGLAMRTGGWLGDHTPPGSITALGDKLFIGSKLVEYGHGLIATNLKGEKLWGRNGLEGWQGPGLLTHDGTAVYAVCQGKRVYRLDPQTYAVQQVLDTEGDDIAALAGRDGKLYVVVKNRLASLSPLRRTGGVEIDWEHAQPTAQPGAAPEHQLSAQSAFATVFSGGGHPQTGLSPTVRGDVATLLLPVLQPIEVGSLVIGRMADTASVEVYALKSGAAFNRDRHVPKEGEKDGLADLDEQATSGLGPDWVLIAKGPLDRAANVLSASQAEFKTSALYLRFKRAGKGTGKWQPRLTMCRILLKRVQPVAAKLQVQLPDGAQAVTDQAVHGGSPAGWDFKAPVPITELNPVSVVVDLGTAQTFDGLGFVNCISPQIKIEAQDAGGEEWREVGRYAAGSTKQTGVTSSTTNSHDVQVPFDAAVTTKALRLTFTAGVGQGRGLGRLAEDPFRCGMGELQLLKLVDPRPVVPTHVLQVRDAADGKVLSTSDDPSVAVKALAFDEAGTLYSVTDTTLNRTVLDGGKMVHTPLYKEFKNAVSLAANKGRIAVGDRGRQAVLVLDAAGKVVATIGDKGGYKRGPWDPQNTANPSGVAIAADGNIWIAEEQYQPKRVSCFGPDGTFIREMFGPPEYGGGGRLDPNLKSFYYRGMEFALDWSKGTATLKALNDRFGTPESPASDAGSFTYTGINRPIYHQGRRYIVGGGVVCLLDGPTWKPAAVMGSAQGSVFLTRKDKWKSHWLAKDLTKSSFIWCDLNGDGDYQVEEVQLFKNAEVGVDNPFSGAYWGSRMGPDLTFWGTQARLAPSRFTSAGVPVYEKEKIQPFDHGKLAGVYMGNETLGGPKSAKSGYGAASFVAADGSLVLEAQPWRVGPDLQLAGGPLDMKRSDYQPPIAGLIMDQPLSWVGSAVTSSPVGEVGIMNGNNGHWFLWSARDGVLLGRIFTGKKGGWSTDLPARRGEDVTDRKHDWETFNGDFVKGEDGKYYVTSGKGFHAISRVDGLDAYQVQNLPVKVTAESLAINEKLRAELARGAKAARQAKDDERTLLVGPLAKRTSKFALDGELEDWGDAAKFDAIDRVPPELDPIQQVAAAYDDKGLYLAFRGAAVVGNANEDFKTLFKTGFCFDFVYRADPRARGRDVAAGDRRIVFGQRKGQWIAVLYDYVNPEVAADKYEEFVSPIAATRIARVVQLGPDDVKIAVRSDYDVERKLKIPEGLTDWTAEVFIAWSALGISPEKNGTLRGDVGVFSADSGGIRVEKRWRWSNPDTQELNDLALEAAIAPSTFGTITFEK